MQLRQAPWPWMRRTRIPWPRWTATPTRTGDYSRESFHPLARTRIFHVGAYQHTTLISCTHPTTRLGSLGSLLRRYTTSGNRMEHFYDVCPKSGNGCPTCRRRTGKPKKARRKFERSAGLLASAWPCGIVNGFAELIGTERYRTISYLQV